MLQIGKNEVIYSRTFLMKAGEVAKVWPTNITDRFIRIVVSDDPHSITASAQEPGEASGNIAIGLPMPKYGQVPLSGECPVRKLSTPDAPVICRWSSQVLPTGMVLMHVDVLLDRAEVQS